MQEKCHSICYLTTLVFKLFIINLLISTRICWISLQRFPTIPRCVLRWILMKTRQNWSKAQTHAPGRVLVSGEMERHWEMGWEPKRSLGKWSSSSIACLLNRPFYWISHKMAVKRSIKHLMGSGGKNCSGRFHKEEMSWALELCCFLSRMSLITCSVHSLPPTNMLNTDRVGVHTIVSHFLSTLDQFLMILQHEHCLH